MMMTQSNGVFVFGWGENDITGDDDCAFLFLRYDSRDIDFTNSLSPQPLLRPIHFRLTHSCSSDNLSASPISFFTLGWGKFWNTAD